MFADAQDAGEDLPELEGSSVTPIEELDGAMPLAELPAAMKANELCVPSLTARPAEQEGSFVAF